MLTRFAPSPTGYLHIGNIRTALLCYLFSKKNGGKFMLRIDDTDKDRSKEEYVDGIKEDLTWLGLNWDEEARQSERFDSYNQAVEKLKEAGRLYACYETGEELDIKRKMQLSRGLPPKYDQSGLNLTTDEIKKFEDKGRKPHYRFKLADYQNITWHDGIRGNTTIQSEHTSDPILIREDGSFTYMLPSTIDDIELGVTHVIRGEDHISNTAIQIQLFDVFIEIGFTDKPKPSFIHNSLIKTKDGKLSKRDGGFTVRSLREDGMEPMAINSFLAKVGTSDPVELRTSLEELVDELDFHKFSKNSTFYAVEDIARLNTKLLHQLEFNLVKDRLAEMGLVSIDKEFWNSVRPNLSTLNEVGDWWTICKENVDPQIEDAEFTSSASEHLPDGDWNEETWSEWISTIKDKTGRKGKELFMPIRKAITGMDHGPELKNLLPLIGREKVVARLNGKEA